LKEALQGVVVMEWFVFTSRLICHIYERLRLRCKDVRIHSHAFPCNLPMFFFGRRYYKSLCVYAEVPPILHNPSRRVCPLRRIAASDSSRQAGVLSANHGRFTGPRICRGQANLGGYERRCNGEKQKSLMSK